MKKKKLMKSIFVFGLAFTMICSSIFSNSVKAAEIELKWKDTVDENGYPIRVLDMTEEEIQMYEIAQLKKKHESNNMQRTSGYTYTYTYHSTLYDSGNNASSYLLIGSRESWTQRESKTYAFNVSFGLQAAYKAITGVLSMSISISETIKFDHTYDSKLGLFAQVQTKKYLVTVKDKYTGTEVDSYYDTVMSTVSNAYRPIYDSDDNNKTIFFKYGSNRYTANTIKPTLTVPVTLASQIVTATRDHFPN